MGGSIRKGRFQPAWVLAAFFLLLLHAWPLWAEYYEYVDENGVRIFTDDQSQIPAGKATVHRERFDHLDEDERTLRIREEQEAAERLNQKVREKLEAYDLKETAEREKKAAADRQKRLARLKTPVVISRRQVLVPVTLEKYGRSTTVTMLLDTGASITTVNESVAQALDITEGRRSAAIVAGGGILRTRLVVLDALTVGPKTMKAKRIMVFPDKGPELGYQGLLGLDFLQNFGFTIDYGQQIIQWAE